MEFSNNPATVYLIGAGPGDPGLITLRGVELLQRADVVLYDGLCNPALLRHAPQAECVCVGKHGQSRIWSQDEIVAEMLRHARNGRCVARLKGGDPAVFARTAEEAESLRKAGICFEIVPGITAALAAGSYAGIPITHRRHASAVALITGHEEPDKSSSSLDWDALAKFPGTLVVYMGVTTAPVWTDALIRSGKSPRTPAAILRRCSLPDQQQIHCQLDEVTDRLQPSNQNPIRPPVIVILGPVTELADTMAWFDRRPLFGQQVLITRPVDQAMELASPLGKLGAEVFLQPAISIGPPEDWTQVDNAIRAIHPGDTLVFSSRNGVRFFLNRWVEIGLDVRCLAGVQIAAVGKRTAESLKSYCLQADLIPEKSCSEGLAETLLNHPKVQQRIWWVRGSRSRDVLTPALQEGGKQVHEVVAYHNTDVVDPDPEITKAMLAGKIDWVTVTSGAIVASLSRMFGNALHKTQFASISPITSQALRNHDLQPTVEAELPTMTALVAAIETATHPNSKL